MQPRLNPMKNDSRILARLPLNLGGINEPKIPKAGWDRLEKIHV